MSIAEYLSALIAQRNKLITTLNGKGIATSENEKFNSLIDKVSSVSVSARGIDKPLYRFGVVSDIHLTDTNFIPDGNNANTKYRRALEYFNANGAEFISIPGDVCNNNHSPDGSYSVTLSEQQYIGELTLFKTLNETYFPNKDVHVCTGNHDATALGYNNAPGGMSALLSEYQDGTKTVAQVWSEITGKSLNYTFVVGNDVFVFHSMFSWNYVNYCRDEDIAWLSGVLSQNADKRVFLFFHVPLPGYYDGPGGETGLILLAEGQGGRSRDFLNIINQYDNIIWFNGHTHYDLALENTYDNPNTFTDTDKLTMVHCPSTSYLRLPGNPYINDPVGSQGYMVDVFPDKVVLQGLDFSTDDTKEIGIKYIITQ